MARPDICRICCSAWASDRFLFSGKGLSIALDVGIPVRWMGVIKGWETLLSPLLFILYILAFWTTLVHTSVETIAGDVVFTIFNRVLEPSDSGLKHVYSLGVIYKHRITRLLDEHRFLLLRSQLSRKIGNTNYEALAVALATKTKTVEGLTNFQVRLLGASLNSSIVRHDKLKALHSFRLPRRQIFGTISVLQGYGHPYHDAFAGWG